VFGDAMRVSDLVVTIDEIVAVEPAVVADEVEDGLACGGEAAAGEVGLVVGGGVDRRGGFFLPDLGAPVADGEEEFGLFAVLRDGEDGSVVTLAFLAEDDIGVEFGAGDRLLASLHLRFLEREQDALLGTDHHTVGAVVGDFETGGVEQLAGVDVGGARLAGALLHQDVVLEQLEVGFLGQLGVFVLLVDALLPGDEAAVGRGGVVLDAGFLVHEARGLGGVLVGLLDLRDQRFAFLLSRQVLRQQVHRDERVLVAQVPQTDLS